MTVELVRSSTNSIHVGMTSKQLGTLMIDGPPGKHDSKPGYWLLYAGLLISISRSVLGTYP